MYSDVVVQNKGLWTYLSQARKDIYSLITKGKDVDKDFIDNKKRIPYSWTVSSLKLTT